MKKFLVLIFSFLICVNVYAQQQNQKGSFEGIYFGTTVLDCAPICDTTNLCLCVRIHDGKNMHEILWKNVKDDGTEHQLLNVKIHDAELKKISFGSKVKADFIWDYGNLESENTYPKGLYPNNVKITVLKQVNNKKLANVLKNVEDLLWGFKDNKKNLEDVFLLATWFENGEQGLPKDLKEAKRLYAEAVDRGHPKARTALDKLEEQSN